LKRHFLVSCRVERSDRRSRNRATGLVRHCPKMTPTFVWPNAVPALWKTMAIDAIVIPVRNPMMTSPVRLILPGYGIRSTVEVQ
jgi:hypothetical protein